MNSILNFIKTEKFKKYFWNTNWIFLSKLIRSAANFIIGIFIARYLGPAQYGVLAYAISFVALFSALSTLGLDQIIVKELVNEPDQKDYLLGSGFVLRSIGSLIQILLVILISRHIESNAITWLIICVISLGVLFDSFQVIDLYFQAQVKTKFNALVSIYALIFSSAIKITLLCIQAPLIWFAATISIEKFLFAFFYIIFYQKNSTSILLWNGGFKYSKYLLSASWPLVLSGLAIMIYMRIDQVMIKNMLSSADLGLYSVAVSISETLYIIPIVITASLFPSLVNSKKADTSLYYRRLSQLFQLLIFISFIIAISLTFLSPFIKFIWGHPYSFSSYILNVHIWSFILVAIGVIISYILINENLQIYSLYTTILGALVNVFLNLWLIRDYGTIGAAVATVIAYASATIFLALFPKTRFIIRILYNTFLFKKMEAICIKT
ncbi:MAG: flippase [Candidatus Omnitrophota bacterium]